MRVHRSSSPPPENRPELSGPEDHVLERLGGGEAQPRACRNLDHLSGRGIAAHPRLALALAENSQPRQPQRAFLLQLANHQRGEFLERGLGLLLGDPDFFSEMRCYLRLRHHPPPWARIVRLPASLSERSSYCKW